MATLRSEILVHFVLSHIHQKTTAEGADGLHLNTKSRTTNGKTNSAPEQ